jgi:LysM repeat protein
MIPDPSFFIKRIRHLSQALILSGALNIGVLSLLLYWMLRERPPTPYCELKPASFEQQQIPLADQRGFTEVLTQLSQLSFSQLVDKLAQTQLIENGYAERDLALSCLVAFHHFNVQRSLPKNAQPHQKRLLVWKPKGEGSSITLEIYPDLTQEHFDALIQFARTEHWPLTAEGLFLQLQKQKEKNELNEQLVETFFLTPEFWTVELLFNRSGQLNNKQEILTLLLEGNWTILKQFVDRQRQVHDSSDARRQKFLLDYLKVGSSSAAVLLLKMEWDFSVKKLDDQQVMSILQLAPVELPESMRFAKEMLTSPRSVKVWREASKWLYAQADEPMPAQWNYQAVLARFVPEKPTIELISKPPHPSPTLPTSLPMTRSKVIVAAPIQSVSVAKLVKVNSEPEKKKVIKAEKVLSKVAVENQNESKKNLLSPSVKLQVYVVEQGDSLWKIAHRFGVKVEELRARNELMSDTLKVGTVLKNPANRK